MTQPEQFKDRLISISTIFLYAVLLILRNSYSEHIFEVGTKKY